jgi:hypothetical protein
MQLISNLITIETISRLEFAWRYLTLDLESSTEISVELNFYAGIKNINIQPFDRERLINFSVNNSCKGLKANFVLLVERLSRVGYM